MKAYIKVPISVDGIVETPEEMQKVDTRAHASEMFYQDAAYMQGVAQEKWPDLVWRTEHARTRKFLVTSQPKRQ